MSQERHSRGQQDRASDSRSPLASAHRHRHHHRHHGRHDDRSRSPHRSHHDPSHPHKRKRSPPARKAAVLPYNAQAISKHDLKTWRPLFALYLDIQKQLLLDDLPDEEARGRWKSFIGKWNRGELAEGWYDPSTNQRALESESAEGEAFEAAPRRRPSPKYDVERHETSRMHKDGNAHEEDDEDDVMGPALPGQEARERPPGPSIPNRQDLQLQREQAEEQEVEALEDLRYNRRQDRKSQREALDELVPRADPGTRERQLEKKREVNDKMRAFRDKSPVDEVRDTDLMGADDAGGLEGFKARKKEMERKKNDRELRREEILRERREEREERMRVHRAKEDETMSMLQVLAKQNFG